MIKQNLNLSCIIIIQIYLVVRQLYLIPVPFRVPRTTIILVAQDIRSLPTTNESITGIFYLICDKTTVI